LLNYQVVFTLALPKDMGRVFTISFDFLNERHMALVSLCGASTQEATCHIQLLNKELYYLLPEGKISFAFNDNGLPPQIENRFAEELYISLRQALSNYLSSKTTTVLK
jgi:hypothetical protein